MVQNKLQQGMQLGNYIINEKLTESIFSQIWFAEHAHISKKRTCLKIFTNPNIIQKFQHHKKIPFFPNVPHFPYIEDFDPNPPFPYLAAEYIAGKSLRQLLREYKKLDLIRSLAIIKKIIKSLSYLHSRNIPHLDLKPENIIITKDNNIVLLDYAIGNIFTSTINDYYRSFTAGKITVLPKPIMRSLIYKSKQHRMGKNLGIKADIFSLGVMFFEMVTGNYPTKKIPLPSHAVPSIANKADKIYINCCNTRTYNNCQDILTAIKEQDEKKDFGPGIDLLNEKTATVTINILAGNKNYVDGKNIALLSKNLENIITSNLKYFAFDFENIDYLNSGAMGFLVNFYDRIQSMDGKVVMFNINNKVGTILDALGFVEVFNIVNTYAEAKEYLLK